MIIFNGIVVLFIVMILASLSGLFAERSGTINIGINGMMLVGAVMYYVVARQLHGVGAYQLIDTLVASLAGVITGVIFGFTSITLKANQIISGTAINLVAAAIGLVILAKTTIDSQKLPDPSIWAVSTSLNDLTHVFSLITFLGLAIIFLCYIMLKKTAWGLRLKAAGENPQALDSQGINVIKTRYMGIMVSGALAGVAGGFFMQNMSLFTGNVEGLGFVALAIMIAGQWRIQWVILVALIFATIYSVAQNITTIKASLDEYQDLLKSVPFVLSLVALAVFSKRSLAPKAAGTAYDKSKR